VERPGERQSRIVLLHATRPAQIHLAESALLAAAGWNSIPSTVVLEACIFPDNSTIDSWGLFYHSDGIIRGIDLSTVLKYSKSLREGED